MINATAHPGPALWFGLMLIVLAFWVLWLNTGDIVEKPIVLSAVLVVIVGLGLMGAILRMGAAT